MENQTNPQQDPNVQFTSSNTASQPQIPQNTPTPQIILLTVIATLLVAGVIYFAYDSITSKDTDQSRSDSAEESYSKYTNTTYGYSFTYPKEDLTLFINTKGEDFESGELIKPTSSDKKVLLTDNVPHLFCCEPTTMSIEVKEGLIHFDNWGDHFKIPEHNIVSKEIILIDGQETYYITGTGASLEGGFAKLLMTHHNGNTVFIATPQDGPQWNAVIDSFTLTKVDSTPKKTPSTKTNASTETSSEIDCGTTSTSLEPIFSGEDTGVFENDEALVCFGKALKNQCQEARIRTDHEGGKSNTVIKIRPNLYAGDCEEVIIIESVSSESDSDIIGTSMTCPIFPISETVSWKNEKDGVAGAEIVLGGILTLIGPPAKCRGSLIDARYEKREGVDNWQLKN